MAKVTEYPRITKIKDNDILLVDGPDGTRTILKSNAAKELGGDIIAVTKSGGKDKVTLNLTDNPVDLATEADVAEVSNALLPIGTASGNPAVVADAKLGTAFREMKVSIEPVQSGSGDASLENVRPISGWTGANIYVSPTSNSADGQTYSITFPTEAGTVYGGTLDVTTGTLTVDTVYIELNSSMNFQPHVWNGMKNVIVENILPYNENRAIGICSHTYKVGTHINDRNNIWIGVNTRAIYWIGIRDALGITTVEEFKTWLDTQRVQIAYKLGNPVTYSVYQLTPQQITALEGLNNVWANCGPVEFMYVKDVKVEEMIAEESNGTASRAFTAGEYVIVRDKLYKVTTNVSSGTTLVPGTNIEETTVGGELNRIEGETEEEVSELKTQLNDTGNRLSLYDGILSLTWVDKDGASLTYAGQRIHNDPAIEIPDGTTVTVPEGYKVKWNIVGGSGSGWFNEGTMSNTQGKEYIFTVRKDPDAAYSSISELSSKIVIKVPENTLADIAKIESDMTSLENKTDETNDDIVKISERFVGVDGEFDLEWLDGDYASTSYNGKRIHNTPFYFPEGTIIAIENTNYTFKWNRISPNPNGSSWMQTLKITLSGYYSITIRKADDSAYASISELSDKITINYPYSLAGEIDEINERISDLANNMSIGGFDPDAYVYRKLMPSYYTNQSNAVLDSYLDEKIYGIPGGSKFIFVTDDHWVSNAKKVIELIQYVRKISGAKIVVNGGDYLNTSQTAQSGINIFTDSAGRYRAAFGSYYLPIRGNHDDNCNAGSTVLTPEELAARFIKPSIVYNTVFGSLKGTAKVEEDVGTKLAALGLTAEHIKELTALLDMTYYVDNEEDRTRYIITNTGATGYIYPKEDFDLGSYTESWLNLPFIAEAIRTIPEGYNIVLMGHMFCDAYATPVPDTDGRLPTYGFVTAVCNMLTALKKKQSVTVAAPYQTGNANFLAYMDFPYTFNFAESNNVGKMLIMMGHYHTDGVCVFDGNMRVKAWDGVSTLTQSGSTVEIPLIQVATDAYQQVLEHSPEMTIDTVTEQAFDVVTMTDDAIVCTRIGAGNDRTIPMNW